MALHTVFVPVLGDWSVLLSEQSAVSVCSSYTVQYALFQVQAFCFLLYSNISLCHKAFNRFLTKASLMAYSEYTYSLLNHGTTTVISVCWI